MSADGGDNGADDDGIQPEAARTVPTVSMAPRPRGPMRLTAEGGLHPDIVAAYQQHGFYVLTPADGERDGDEQDAGETEDGA